MRAAALTTMAALLVAAASLAMACGGDGEALTLEEYFQRLDEVDTTFEERMDALDTEFTDEFESLSFDDAEGAATVFEEFFNQAREPINNLVDGIDDLNPPPEAEDAHDRAVTAGRRVVDAFEGMIDKVRDASPEELFEVMEGDQEFDDAAAAFDDACTELQSIADEHDIDIDLDCEDLG